MVWPRQLPGACERVCAVDLETTGLSPRLDLRTRTPSSPKHGARELGIPLIAEPVFLTMLQRGVISDPLVTNGQKPSGVSARPPLAAHS
jgi:hypothetical protein